MRVKCLVSGFVTSAPAFTHYQQGRGIYLSRRELVGERLAYWIREEPTAFWQHNGMVARGHAVGIQAKPADQAAPEGAEGGVRDPNQKQPCRVTAL